MIWIVDISVFPGQTTPETVVYSNTRILRLIYQLKVAPDLTSSWETVIYNWMISRETETRPNMNSKYYIEKFNCQVFTRRSSTPAPWRWLRRRYSRWATRTGSGTNLTTTVVEETFGWWPTRSHSLVTIIKLISITSSKQIFSEHSPVTINQYMRNLSYRECYTRLGKSPN